MSDDPFLYNDQLRSPAIGWNDVPQLLQKEIFEQLGCFRLVGFRRVCHNWKSLLEESSRFLLVDELTQARLSIWKRRRSKILGLGNPELPTWFMNSHKEFSKVLQGVYKKARVIIVDFAGQDCASDLVQKQLHDYVMLFVCEEFSVALASNGKLEHLILTGGRTSPDFYFKLLRTIRLYRTRRPLKVTLLNCSMKYTASNLLIVGGTSTGIEWVRNIIDTVYQQYQVFPQEHAEERIPEFSLRILPDENLYETMLLMFRNLFFLYSNTQIEWLETCLQTVQNLEAGSLSWGFPGLPPYCRACLLKCTLGKRYHQEMVGIEFFSKTAKPYTTSYFLYIEILAVAISYFARMISTGKLAFPPPPQPVMLCPVHTKSAICPCLLSSKDADKSLEKKVSYSPL